VSSASKALQFDGTAYVSIPGDRFRNLQSGALSVWIRPTAGGGVILTSLHDTSNDRQFFPAVADRGDGPFSVSMVGVTKSDRFDFSLETDDRFPLNAWHHLVYTSAKGSGRFQLYIDGKPQHMHVSSFGRVTDFFFADLMRGGDDLQIGAKSDSHSAHSSFFHGVMRDLMIFDQVLSQEEVTALAAAGPGGDLSRYARMGSLVAGYHLDEMRGTTVADFSGHGNDGTLHGGVTRVSGQGIAPAPHARALQFDGKHYGTLPQSTKFTAGDFTVSLWFDPTTDNKSHWLFMRGFGWHDQRGDIGLMINPHSGDLDFVANTGGNSQWLFGWDAPESRLRSAFKLNAWNHVVVTRRGHTYTMWMNGARAGSERSSADISDSDDTNPFIVCGFMYDGGVQQMFQGALDELRIFHRCLSDGEIAALYSDGGGKSAPAARNLEGPTPVPARDIPERTRDDEDR
jgi:hypothetical protein